jgi:hypothetical protein
MYSKMRRRTSESDWECREREGISLGMFECIRRMFQSGLSRRTTGSSESQKVSGSIREWEEVCGYFLVL